MLLVRVELVSAITGRITEIARMRISNIGGSKTRGDYEAAVFWGRDKDQLSYGRVHKRGQVAGHARVAEHVWHLVGKALAGMEYGITKAKPNAKGAHVARSCLDKVRHGSREGADIHKARVEHVDGETGLAVYACKFCGGFHVGHPP